MIVPYTMAALPSPCLKPISAILAILILFLSVQPVCIAAQPVAIEEACCANGCVEEDAGNPEHEKGCNGCNPFQSCSCCTASVIVPQAGIGIPVMIPEFAAASWEQVDVDLVETALADFWQPPRRA
jgi:hypothetical protein